MGAEIHEKYLNTVASHLVYQWWTECFTSGDSESFTTIDSVGGRLVSEIRDDAEFDQFGVFDPKIGYEIG